MLYNGATCICLHILASIPILPLSPWNPELAYWPQSPAIINTSAIFNEKENPVFSPSISLLNELYFHVVGDSISTVEFYEPKHSGARWKLGEPMKTLRSRVGIAVLKG